MRPLPLAVAQASSEPVVAASARLGAGTNGSFPFLSAAHQLTAEGAGAGDFLDGCMRKSVSGSEFNILAEYLALASCCHALDGWRYLSSSASAMLSGARRAALHLAYYAELRAARSALASSGIGIRDTWHFSLSGSGSAIPFGGPRRTGKPRTKATGNPLRHLLSVVLNEVSQALANWWRGTDKAGLTEQEQIGTHNATWKVIKEWSKLPHNGKKVVSALKALHFRGVDWIEACSSAAMREDLAANWLENWSCDLRHLEADSRARNRASYGVDLRPDAFAPIRAEELDLIRNANRAVLATDDGSVDEIDLVLIHDFVVKSARKVSGRRLSFNQIWVDLRNWLEGPGNFPPAEAGELATIIRNAINGPGGAILTSARVHDTNATCVFCRALLLLRLATAMMKQVWHEAASRAPGGSITWAPELLRSFALNSNLVPTDVVLTDYRTLEQDQIDALSDVDSWMAANPFNGHAFWATDGLPFTQLSRFERAGLWTASP